MSQQQHKAAHQSPKPPQEKSLLNLSGKNKGSGLYKDADDADQYISNLRDEWK